MLGRALVFAAALLMGAPGLAVPASGDVVWIELCDPLHQGVRIPLPFRDDRDDRDDRDGAPAKACHATCGALAGRRQAARR